MNYSFIFVFSGFIFTQGPAVPKKLPRQYACRQHFLDTDFSSAEKKKVPNLYTAVSTPMQPYIMKNPL
jgi:hypothetical protein